MASGPLAARFADAYRREYTVSLRPDLPNTLTPPDLMIAKAGSLVAFFEPTRLEIRHPQRLVVRLLLSRLALPDHVRCVLLLDESASALGIEGDMRHHFHTVAMPRSAPRTIAGQALQSPVREVPKTVRRHVQLQAALLLDAVRLATDPLANATRSSRGALEMESTNSLELLAHDHLQKGTATLSDVEFGAHTVVVRKHAGSRSLPLRQEFQRYMSIVPLLTFNVDNGVPHPGRSVAGVFRPSNQLTPAVTVSRFARPAAMAGWSIVTSRDEGVVARIVDRLETWARNHPYERA